MPSKDPERVKAIRRRCYHKHRVAYRKKTRDRQQALKQWMLDYKSQLQCSRCPETHVACLEFHHRDPKTKAFEISQGAHYGYSIATMLAEIAKCDVLCANCHRKQHAQVDGIVAKYSSPKRLT